MARAAIETKNVVLSILGIALMAMSGGILCDFTPPAIVPPYMINPGIGWMTVDIDIAVITDVDATTKTCEFDGVLTLWWDEERTLPFTPGETDEETGFVRSNNLDWSDSNGALSDVWNPALMLLNKMDAELTDESMQITTAVPPLITYSARVQGRIYARDVPFEDFPFDSPVVYLSFRSQDQRDIVWTYDYIKHRLPTLRDFFPEAPNDHEYNMGEWTAYDVFTQDESFVTGLDARVYVCLRRNSDRYVLRIVLPIILITIASFVVFFMGTDWSTRVGTSSTMMLAVIAFLFLVSSEVPSGAIPTTTKLDKFILLNFCLIFFTNLENIMAKVLQPSHEVKVSKEIPFIRKRLAKLHTKTREGIFQDIEMITAQKKADADFLEEKNATKKEEEVVKEGKKERDPEEPEAVHEDSESHHHKRKKHSHSTDGSGSSDEKGKKRKHRRDKKKKHHHEEEESGKSTEEEGEPIDEGLQSEMMNIARSSSTGVTSTGTTLSVSQAKTAKAVKAKKQLLLLERFVYWIHPLGKSGWVDTFSKVLFPIVLIIGIIYFWASSVRDDCQSRKNEVFHLFAEDYGYGKGPFDYLEYDGWDQYYYLFF
ncbi:nicotinic acetylcholine receptor beta-2 [Pelomyxa schiedti]|nr:nicotinic acetylcholine receptor beta-2 [Pelomyxa schiedti]